MVINHNLGNIELDDEDIKILDNWQFITVQKQGKWQYAILYSERDNGCRTSRYLAREVLGITDPLIEVKYMDGNGCNCKKDNLSTSRRTWKTRKRKTQNA